MMKKEFIKWQMKNVGLSINKLKDISGVPYASLNDFLNKEDYAIKAENYERLIETLFTPYERMVYEFALQKSVLQRKKDVYGYYEELIKRSVKDNLENGSLKILRSGAPTSDDEGVMRSLPVNVQLTFYVHGMKQMIRIFDKDIYNQINEPGKTKEELIKEYFSI
ncbi:hypothetical protein [Macrococcoides canis]|uniref:hypothetical protein n=1 Tax=Macrococcoides canis TaxID=1855823 RepID=UPI0020B8FC2F|nr:hypothetical protein [Macrococcus canis]UTG99311.1 hypothetical protein KFV04_07295 [Macrococcus canis]